MGKQSRAKAERQAVADLVALQREIGPNGLKFGVGIEPGSANPILLQFKAGDKIILPTCWDVRSARAMAKSLNKYCDLHESGRKPKPAPSPVPDIGDETHSPTEE